MIINHSSSHSSTLQHGIQDLLQRGALADCHFEVEGKKIACHRLVLAACSPVLQALFTSGMMESQTGVIPIQLFGLETMEAIVR